MASGIVSPFIRAIQETTGKRTPEFAETVLGLKYPTFVYRMRNGCLRFTDYLKICEATGLSLADLFRLLGGDVVRSHGVQESVQGSVSVNPIEVHKNGDDVHRVEDQVKEPLKMPFVVEDLPLTMPD